MHKHDKFVPYYSLLNGRIRLHKSFHKQLERENFGTLLLNFYSYLVQFTFVNVVNALFSHFEEDKT